MTHDSSTPTQDDRPDSDRPTRRTMRSVSQTNPYTGENFGDTLTFHRGTTVVADGGAADRVSEDGADADVRDENADSEEENTDVADENPDERDADRQRMRDVDKTPPEGAPSPNRVYMRGGERPRGEEVAEE